MVTLEPYAYEDDQICVFAFLTLFSFLSGTALGLRYSCMSPGAEGYSCRGHSRNKAPRKVKYGACIY
jgi:hypothetical protein